MTTRNLQPLVVATIFQQLESLISHLKLSCLCVGVFGTACKNACLLSLWSEIT